MTRTPALPSPSMLTPLEFVAVILAASRATTAVTHDSILNAQRDAYVRWTKRHAPKLTERAGRRGRAGVGKRDTRRD